MTDGTTLIWIVIMFGLFYIYVDNLKKDFQRFKKDMLFNYANLEMMITGNRAGRIANGMYEQFSPGASEAHVSPVGEFLDLIPTKEENANGLLHIGDFKKGTPNQQPPYAAETLFAYDRDASVADYAPFIIKLAA